MTDLDLSELRERHTPIRVCFGFPWSDTHDSDTHARCEDCRDQCSCRGALPCEVITLAEQVEGLRAKEAARLRDLGYAEFVPESVTDAAFASQSDWWKPGDGDGHAMVLVPQLIESVAEAAYRATLAHLKEVSE